MPRGSRSSGNSSSGRYNVSPSRNVDTFHSWEVDGELFCDAIRAVLANGDAILLSLTSDGGALSIKLYSEGNKQAVYCADAAELDLVLNTLKASSID